MWVVTFPVAILACHAVHRDMLHNAQIIRKQALHHRSTIQLCSDYWAGLRPDGVNAIAAAQPCFVGFGGYQTQVLPQSQYSMRV